MFIKAILEAQGYDSELEQYTIQAEIERTADSSIMLASHNLFGVKVVIKTVPSEIYHAKAANF